MQDRYRQLDEILLRRTAGPYIGSFASISAHPSEVRFTPDSDQKADVPDWSLSAMYGRRPRCKGKIGHFSEAFGCSHVFGLFRLEDYLCRDAAAVAAGPDVIR